MKKSLIALAVAGTLVAPAAMADTSNVNVYGEVNMSFDLVKTGDTTGSVSTNQVSSNESRLGFKGSEDLGGGLSAVYEVEGDIWADSGIGLLATRHAFAGLKSDALGSLTLGTQNTPYKVSTRSLDLFADGIADNRSLMGKNPNGNHDTQLPDTIAYMSPSMNGFSVAAAYSMGAEEADTPNQSKGKAISVAGMYNMAPFYAAIAHQKITHGDATGNYDAGAGESEKAFKFGGGYKVDMFAVNAVIENIESVVPGTKQEVQNIYLSGQYNITGNDAVKLAYTRSGDWETNGVEQTDTGATQVSLGYDHSLSKRTSVYALWTKLSNKTNVDHCLDGVSSSGGPGGFGACSNDSDPSAFSFGMKHSF